MPSQIEPKRTSAEKAEPDEPKESKESQRSRALQEGRRERNADDDDDGIEPVSTQRPQAVARHRQDEGKLRGEANPDHDVQGKRDCL